MKMKNLLQELYDRIADSDFLEHVKCMNPSYSFRKIYRDDLTGYPNSRDLRRSIKKLSKKKQSVAIYTIDATGLKFLNDNHGYKAGNELISMALDTSEQVASKYGGKTYREYGDDFVVLIHGIDEVLAGTIPNEIEQLCKPYRCEHIPMNFPLRLHIGHAFSSDGKNLFELLDISREETNKKRKEFYETHPALDGRNRNKHTSVLVKSQ